MGCELLSVTGPFQAWQLAGGGPVAIPLGMDVFGQKGRSDGVNGHGGFLGKRWMNQSAERGKTSFI